MNNGEPADAPERWTPGGRSEPDALAGAQRDADTFADLREFAAAAADIVVRGRAAFDAPTAEGRILRYAARTVVVNVSTAADRLSDEFRAAHPDIAWRAIRGARNRVAHDYRGVHDDIVWTTLARSIPEMMTLLANSQR